MPYDPKEKKATVRSAKTLKRSVPDCVVRKCSLAKTPSFYSQELGVEIVAFLAKYNWRGMLPSAGGWSA